MGIELFSSKEVGEYTSKIFSGMRFEIEEFSDEKILNCDLEEWADYFSESYRIEPIVIYKDNITKNLEEQKVQVFNQWSQMYSDEPRYFTVDGYHIDFIIPFDGDSMLWRLKPSSFIFQDYLVEDIKEPTKDKCGELIFRLVYTASDLKNKGENINSFIEKQFDSVFKNYEQMISNVNSVVNAYNNEIRHKALELLNKRKSKALDFSAISKALMIPMKLSKDAPNIRPIELKRVERKPIAKPKERFRTPEYCISDEDYENIINIIHSQCSVMETAPEGFSLLEEEKLRDILISTLETHYVNNVSGETFRKNGKTDIQVRFENKAAFIAECKIWHGIKKFEDAIKQLFGYTTWKDTKVALIFFNKGNKNFNSILSSVDGWTKEKCKDQTRKNGNIWKCTFYREDTETDVKVTIAVYDISM